MHLLVLGAFGRGPARRAHPAVSRFNAPSGARCFPTVCEGARHIPDFLLVSMHLLVLGAFRPDDGKRLLRISLEVSMHLLVLGAFRPEAHLLTSTADGSQCTFWCLVLSDSLWGSLWGRLGCFNAPSGAWCFPTESPGPTICPDCVSMHLLVLGAFRLYPQKTAPQRRLLERNRRRPRKHRIRPAHTAPIKPHNRRKPPQTTPAPPTPPTHQYTTGFQQTQAKKPPPRTFGIVSDTGEKQARRNRPLTGLRQPDIIRRPTRTPPVLAPPPASRHRLLTAPPAYPPYAAHIHRRLA